MLHGLRRSASFSAGRRTSAINSVPSAAKLRFLPCCRMNPIKSRALRGSRRGGEKRLFPNSGRHVPQGRPQPRTRIPAADRTPHCMPYAFSDRCYPGDFLMKARSSFICPWLGYDPHQFDAFAKHLQSISIISLWVAKAAQRHAPVLTLRGTPVQLCPVGLSYSRPRIITPIAQGVCIKPRHRCPVPG